MLSSAQVEQFHRDGFLKSGKVLTDEAVDELREEMARVICDRDKGGKQPVLCHNFSREETPVWQIVNIWEASEPFHALISNPIVVAEVGQLTGAETLRMWHDQIQYKPAAAGGGNMWHP